MIHSFYTKAKTIAAVSDLGEIETTVGNHIGFKYNKSGEEFKVFYFTPTAGVVIEDNHGYILEISLNQL